MIAPQISVYPTPAEVAAEAARRVVATAQAAVKERGVFRLALAGGSTPKALYQLLAAEPHVSAMPWDDTEIFFGDERCVAKDHKDSNYLMAEQAFLSKVPLPPENINRMKGEIDPTAAAEEYDKMLHNVLGAGLRLDIVLLGMGDDGHTASLFPHTKALEEKTKWVVANYAENSTTGKSWRITFTAPFINRAAEVMFLICGASKAARLQEVIEGDRDPMRLPSQLISPEGGKLTLLLDAAAAEMAE